VHTGLIVARMTVGIWVNVPIQKYLAIIIHLMDVEWLSKR
jgi:hypothetical protein